MQDKSYGASLNYGRTVGKKTCILVSDPKQIVGKEYTGAAKMFEPSKFSNEELNL